MVKERTVIKTQ